jgi:hypothetical protein
LQMQRQQVMQQQQQQQQQQVLQQHQQQQSVSSQNNNPATVSNVNGSVNNIGMNNSVSSGMSGNTSNMVGNSATKTNVGGVGSNNSNTNANTGTSSVLPNMEKVLGVDEYGLLGLLGVIRMTNPDLNQLALGTDLTSMGLNLNAPGALYTSMGSPWTEEPAVEEKPAYQIPSCYEMPPPPLKASHLKKFHVRSLFFMFYSMPRDILQAYAAKELHTRGWRFHKDLRLWFTRDNATGPNGLQPKYVYFDSNVWERRIFDGNLPQTGFMTDADMNFENNNHQSNQQNNQQNSQQNNQQANQTQGGGKTNNVPPSNQQTN